MNYKKLDIATWKRKEHFEFFSKFEEPFAGLVADVDITIAKRKAKEHGFSLFAYYLYQSITAINQIEEFRYRIKGEEVLIYDQIHTSATIGREDETFGFSFTEYQDSFEKFQQAFAVESKRVQGMSGLCFDDNALRQDVIHYSAIPWVSFKGLTHARNFNSEDSVPKLNFGKIYQEKDRFKMPVSVHTHHALLDGIHKGKYFELFQELLNQD